MRVLVIGSDRHAAEGAIRTLHDAGHDVVRCHDADEPPFPCKALTSGCPLDVGDPMDVALVVREHPWPRPTVHESGVPCAVRAGIPLVVAGKTMLHPYEQWADEVVHGDRGLVEACEQAARRMTAVRSALATEALTDALARSGVDAPEASVEVVRHGRGLRATARTGPGIERDVAQRAAVRMVQVLRADDPHADGIDVDLQLEPAGEEAADHRTPTTEEQ